MKSRQQKREEAEARNEKWAGLTWEQKMAALDRRLGRDQGAEKQRAKLLKEGELEGQKPSSKAKKKKKS